jgi:hypothetical protein
VRITSVQIDVRNSKMCATLFVMDEAKSEIRCYYSHELQLAVDSLGQPMLDVLGADWVEE